MPERLTRKEELKRFLRFFAALGVFAFICVVGIIIFFLSLEDKGFCPDENGSDMHCIED